MIDLFTKRIYWVVQMWIDRAQFWKDKLLFTGNRKYEDSKTISLIVWGITKSAIVYVFASFLLVYSFTLIDGVVSKPIVDFLGQSHLLFKHVIETEGLLDWSIKINDYLRSEGYQTFLVTIVSVIGIYVGVYYTVVGFLANSSVSNLPINLRRVLIEERINNVYIQFLTFTIPISLINLLFQSVVNANLFLNFIFVLVIGFVSIFAFLNLAKRVLYQLDPKVILDYIITEVIKYSKLGVKAKSRHMQAHFQKLVDERIGLFDPIYSLIKKDSLVSYKELEEVSQKLILLLSFYSDEIRVLSSKSSYWFKRKYEHSRWFLTDWSKEEVSLNAKVSLPPDEIPDLYWFEDAVFDLLIENIIYIIDNKKYMHAITVLTGISEYLAILAKHLDHKAIEKRYQQLEEVFSPERIQGLKVGVKDNDKNTHALIDGLLDMFPFTIVNTHLGLLKTLTKGEIKKRVSIVESVWQLDSKAIYSSGLNEVESRALEVLYKQLVFEKTVEGRVITPKSFIYKAIFDPYSQELDKTIKSFQLIVDQFISKFLESLVENKEYRYASVMTPRLLELFSKIRNSVDKAKEFISDLNKYSSETAVKVSAETILEKVEEQEEKSFSIISKIIPYLKPDNNNLVPDYYGEAFNFLYLRCFEYLINNESEKFLIAFKSLFPTALNIFSNLLSKLTEYQLPVDNKVKINAQPLIEMFRLSGYAYLASKVFDKDEYWIQVKGVWDKYLENNDERATFILSYYIYADSVFRVNMRDAIKFNFASNFKNKLIQLKILSANYSTFSYPFDRQEDPIKSKDPLVRVWAKHSDFTDSEDIFVYILFYDLMKKNKMENRAIESIADLVEREKENEKKK